MDFASTIGKTQHTRCAKILLEKCVLTKNRNLHLHRTWYSKHEFRESTHIRNTLKWVPTVRPSAPHSLALVRGCDFAEINIHGRMVRPCDQSKLIA